MDRLGVADERCCAHRPPLLLTTATKRLVQAHERVHPRKARLQHGILRVEPGVLSSEHREGVACAAAITYFCKVERAFRLQLGFIE